MNHVIRLLAVTFCLSMGCGPSLRNSNSTAKAAPLRPSTSKDTIVNASKPKVAAELMHSHRGAARDSSDRPARYGRIRIDFRGESHAISVKLNDYAPFPSWRDDLLTAFEGSDTDLLAFLKKLTIALTTDPNHGRKGHSQSPLSAELKDVKIENVIAYIARTAQIKIISTLTINEPITLHAKDAPWQTVISELAKVLGLLVLDSDSTTVRLLHPDEHLKTLETRVYRLGHLKHLGPPLPPPRVARGNKSIEGFKLTPAEREYEKAMRTFAPVIIIESLMSMSPSGEQLGRLDSDAQTRSCVVRNTKEILGRIERILNVLEAKPE